MRAQEGSKHQLLTSKNRKGLALARKQAGAWHGRGVHMQAARTVLLGSSKSHAYTFESPLSLLLLDAVAKVRAHPVHQAMMGQLPGSPRGASDQAPRKFQCCRPQ